MWVVFCSFWPNVTGKTSWSFEFILDKLFSLRSHGYFCSLQIHCAFLIALNFLDLCCCLCLLALSLSFELSTRIAHLSNAKQVTLTLNASHLAWIWSSNSPWWPRKFSYVFKKFPFQLKKDFICSVSFYLGFFFSSFFLTTPPSSQTQKSCDSFLLAGFKGPGAQLHPTSGVDLQPTEMGRW